MTFAAQIKAARCRLRLTQLEAARLSGYGKRIYEYWESAEREPRQPVQESVLARLARAQPKKPPLKTTMDSQGLAARIRLADLESVHDLLRREQSLKRPARKRVLDCIHRRLAQLATAKPQ